MERMIELHWHHGHGVVWLKPSAVVAIVDYSQDALGSRPAASGIFLDGHGASLIKGPPLSWYGPEAGLKEVRPRAVKAVQTELPCPSCK